MPKFDGLTSTFIKKPALNFFFLACESLVSNNGSILLSSNQIKEKKLEELPFNVVIFATTSQIVDTISEGFRKIKNAKCRFIPSNITTIQDFETEKEKDFMTYGSSTKNLYLFAELERLNQYEGSSVRSISGVLYISIVIFAMYTSREWFMGLFFVFAISF